MSNQIISRLGGLVEEFLAHRQQEKGLDKKSYNAYLTDLKQFGEYVSDHNISTVEEIDKPFLRTYMDHLEERFKFASVKRKVASLNGFYQYLEDSGRIEENRMLGLRIKRKEKKQPPKTLSWDQLRNLFKTAYREKDKCHKDSREYAFAVRDLAIIEVLYGTGMRVSELCGLRREHIDLEAGTARIVVEGGPDRIVPFLYNSTIEVLKELFELFARVVEEDGAVFYSQSYKPLGDQAIRLILTSMSKSAGLEEELTPHMFRHTVATVLLDKSFDIMFVQKLLGHSSLVVTEIYTKITLGEEVRPLKEFRAPSEMHVTFV